MGNCQAIDAAALVIQHPDGRLERMYWPVTASEVMRTNPGHYVSLIIPLPGPDDERKESDRQDPHKAAVRFTRVKLLRPTETLALGHAYRLITSQEVMKVLKAKKYGKTKQRQQQSGAAEKANAVVAKDESSDTDAISKVSKRGIQRPRLAAAGSVAVGRSKSWRPSLQSIDECGSR